jgi:hypothetical protein
LEGGGVHEDGEAVAFSARLPVSDHIEEEVDEDGGHKLRGIVDDLVRNGHPQQTLGGVPACPPLPRHRSFSVCQTTYPYPL